MFANGIPDFLPDEAEQFLAQSSEYLAQGMHSLFEALENHPQATTLFYVFNSIIIFMYLHSQKQRTKQLQLELQEIKQKTEGHTQTDEAPVKILQNIMQIVNDIRTNQEEFRDTVSRNFQANSQRTRQIEVTTERIIEKLGNMQEALFEEVAKDFENLTLSDKTQPSYLPSNSGVVQEISSEDQKTSPDLEVLQAKVSPS